MKVTIILTSTVNVNFSKLYLFQTNNNERVQTYIKSVLSWLNNTSFHIILVENSGYDFKELDKEKETYKDRFEVITFDENTLEQASYLKGSTSKGESELFSISYAFHNSKIIKNSNFIIKITARFFIPDLEEYLIQKDLEKYDCLIQDNPDRCQMVGSHFKNFIHMFNIASYDENNNYVHHVEHLYKYRVSKYKNVLVCKKFSIPETQEGGTNNKLSDI